MTRRRYCGWPGARSAACGNWLYKPTAVWPPNGSPPRWSRPPPRWRTRTGSRSRRSWSATCDTDDQVDALVAAAREAMVNAARHAKVATVSLYAEVEEDKLSVFVRDRGAGFDLSTVDEDRHGVRGSIIGRMQRHGGQAEIRTAPGEGTEVGAVHAAGPSEGETSRSKVTSALRVFLVDDHAMFRAGVRAELGAYVRGDRRGEHGAEAVTAITAAAARRRAARRAHARRRRPGGAGRGAAQPPAGEVPGAVRVGRRRGRDRPDPGRGPRVRHEDHLAGATWPTRSAGWPRATRCSARGWPASCWTRSRPARTPRSPTRNWIS